MSSPPARLFIGSSAEGQDVAANLQDELEARTICEVDLWKHVFEPSRYALESLLKVAARVDFAVLVASPDDVTESRGVEAASVRDNIVLEFGLFAGALGRERTYLLATGEAKLPTDVLGLTRLPFRSRSDGNLRAAVNGAVLEIAAQVERLGRLERSSTPASAGSAATALGRELDLLCANAAAQGWTVKSNTSTTLRLRAPRGQTFALRKGQPDFTRAELRRFAARLRAAGLRVNSSVWRPVDESPF